MGRIESLRKGVAIWTALEAQYKAEMNHFKQTHKLWWFMPSYWKLETKHHKTFLQLINYRIKYATAVKESAK